MAAIAKPRQQSLLEFAGAPAVLHICPCCLNKTARDPADIMREVEARRAAKEEARAARARARHAARVEAQRRFMETHVPVPRQSTKTGRWLDTVEWIPKIMLETHWMIPSHVYHRMVAGFAFSKAHGHDVMVFRAKHATTEWVLDEATGTRQLVTRVERFMLWDLLFSAFKPGTR
ncbi:MAG: hypothetical protein Q6370_002170 [Candidatus Sigynarchaeota archaeon]